MLEGFRCPSLKRALTISSDLQRANSIQKMLKTLDSNIYFLHKIDNMYILLMHKRIEEKIQNDACPSSACQQILHFVVHT